MISHDKDMIFMIKNNFIQDMQPLIADEQYKELIECLEIVIPDAKNEIFN